MCRVDVFVSIRPHPVSPHDSTGPKGDHGFLLKNAEGKMADGSSTSTTEYPEMEDEGKRVYTRIAQGQRQAMEETPYSTDQTANPASG